MRIYLGFNIFENTSDPDYDPDNESSDDDKSVSNSKKSISDHILWKMCKTGVSFAMLSRILNLSFSVLNEDQNYYLSPTHLFKRYQKLAETKELEYQREIRAKRSFGTIFSITIK